MNGLDQIIVALWFLPVVLIIIVPLCMTCLFALFSILAPLFRPIAGQERKPMKISSLKKQTA